MYDLPSKPKADFRSPRSFEDVTAAWLSKILTNAAPGVEVLTCEHQEQIWGCAGKLRVKLSYNEVGQNAGLPDTLILKAGFGIHPIEYEAPSNYPELYAYREIVPQLPVNSPKIYFAETDGDGRTLLVMQDLRGSGASFCSVQSPLAYDDAAKFLAEFAAIHARWWNSPDLAPGAKFDFVPDTLEPSGGKDVLAFLELMFLTEEYWEELKKLPRYHSVPRSYHDLEKLKAGIYKLQGEWRKLPKCMVHGDEHLGNLYMDADGNPGMIDWQCKKAPWVETFAYFTAASLDLEDRRKWERPLLQHYLDCLIVHGVSAPTFDDAWLAYRQAILFPLAVWLTVPPGIQSESNCVACVTRVAAAALDHDTLGVLGV